MFAFFVGEQLVFTALNVYFVGYVLQTESVCLEAVFDDFGGLSLWLNLIHCKLIRRLNMLLPIDHVLYCSIRGHFCLRHYRTDNIPNWHHDIVTESRLLLADSYGVSVAQEGSRHVVRLFQIALREELIEQEVRPVPQRLEISGRR